VHIQYRVAIHEWEPLPGGSLITRCQSYPQICGQT